MPITSQHEKYIKYAPKWQRTRDVVAGQDTMRAAGERYIPKLLDQPKTEYDAMVLRTPFYNASWRTLNGYYGLVFRKPPKTVVPKNVEAYFEDVSMQSKSFMEFVKCFTLEWLMLDNCGILVDHPTAPNSAEEITLANAEAMGLRPTMQIYKTEDILNWKFRKVNNKNVLSRVVLQELFVAPDPNDEWVDKTEPRYRVLDLDEANLYRVRVFRIGRDQREELVEGPIYPLMNGKPLDYIPFYFNADFEEPPMIDLIDANVCHYQVSVDYRHGVHFTALPTPVITGVNNFNEKGEEVASFYIGSTSAWVFPNAEADAKFLEFTGQGLDGIEKYVERVENWMVVLGARLLQTEKAGVEAFKTQANRQVGETSVLAQISIEISDKIKEAIKTFTRWSNSDDKDVDFQLNREFMPVAYDAPTLLAWINGWQQGALSEAELFDLLKRGDVIDPEKTLEEHQGEIDAAPPPAPPSNVQPGALGTLTHEQQTANEAAKAKALAQAAPPPPKGK
jgi:hypothetical protein